MDRRKEIKQKDKNTTREWKAWGHLLLFIIYALKDVMSRICRNERDGEKKIEEGEMDKQEGG